MSSIGVFRLCGTKHCITWTHHCVPEGFKRVLIQPDGSCLFRSIVRGTSLKVSHEDKQVRALRRRVAASLRQRLRRSSPAEKRELFKRAGVVTAPEFDAYVKSIGEQNSWGGELELFELSQWYWIVLHQGTPPTLVYHRLETGAVKPVHILYNGENHYDLLIPLAGRGGITALPAAMEGERPTSRISQ